MKYLWTYKTPDGFADENNDSKFWEGHAPSRPLCWVVYHDEGGGC